MRSIIQKKPWLFVAALGAAALLTLVACGGSSPADTAHAAGSSTPASTPALAAAATPSSASSASPVTSAAPVSSPTPDAGSSTPADTPTVVAGDGGSRTPLSTPTATPSGSGGGGGGGSTTSSSGTPRSTRPPRAAAAIAGFAFSPPTLTVKVGTKVTWTNNDASPHTVTSTDGPSTGAKTTGLFDSGTVNRGRSFSFTFDKAGTYYYECTFHASMATMHATVIVR